MDTEKASEKRKIDSLAGRVMKLAGDDILMHLRFFQLALAKLELAQQPGECGGSVHGNRIGGSENNPFRERD